MSNDLLDKLIAHRKRLEIDFGDIEILSAKGHEKISYINGFNEAVRLVRFYFRDQEADSCSVCGGRGDHICGFGVSSGKPVHFPIYSREEDGPPPLDSDDK